MNKFDVKRLTTQMGGLQPKTTCQKPPGIKQNKLDIYYIIL